MAGGHLGWKTRDELDDPANRLELLLPPVLEVAAKYGDIPVIVAGGVYTHEDIVHWLRAGAAAVQMGTRFLATEESDASPLYKASVLQSQPDDIIVAVQPGGSPCGYPFRILKTSPMYQDMLQRARPVNCDKGYVLINGACVAREDNRQAFCICNGLLAALGYNDQVENPIFTVGANAWRVNQVVPVADLMAELIGVPVQPHAPEPQPAK
jgi:nitronate monooxygenase